MRKEALLAVALLSGLAFAQPVQAKPAEIPADQESDPFSEADAAANKGKEPAKEPAKAPETGATPAEQTAETAAEEQPRFPIRHGFFTQGDFGVFMSMGGKTIDVNAGATASKGISNAQPYAAFMLGYDVLHGTSYRLSLGLRVLSAFSGGAGRVTADSEATGDFLTQSSDFGFFGGGLDVGFSYFLGERLALTLRGEGGMLMVSPDPLLSADQEGAGGSVAAPFFGGGLGVDFFTLLNDFSVGLFGRFITVMRSGDPIPGVSITVPIRYTF